MNTGYPKSSTRLYLPECLPDCLPDCLMSSWQLRSRVSGYLAAITMSVLLAGCASEQGAGVVRQERDVDEANQTDTHSGPAPILHSDPSKPQPTRLEEVVVSAAGEAEALYDSAVAASSALNRQHGKVARSYTHIAPPHHPLPDHYPLPPVSDNEQYPEAEPLPIRLVRSDPVSTFSVDVDTASYSNVRRFLNQGVLPPADAVRSEEMINYFSYDYPRPRHADAPFSIYTEIAPSPYSPGRHLLHVGLQGYDVERADLPPANLVFLVDVSGSMQSPDKLPLLKNGLKMLVKQMRPRDRISLVVYAGASGVVLPPTAGDQKGTIVAALNRLRAGGSTHGSAGIRLAYAQAAAHFVEDGINRVILATDGDFNVGMTDERSLKQEIERQRARGISLTILGFGQGNYNDALMQTLAQNGNGNAAYIDSVHEARKVLVDELGSTLHTIAKDVKIQIEFNPAQVAEYRLIGYETRALRREDFNNDRVDAGDIGAGHTVTALYEIALVDSPNRWLTPLRYSDAHSSVSANQGDHATHNSAGSAVDATSGELAELRLRFKLPRQDSSQLVTRRLLRGDISPALAQTTERFRFSAAVSGFSEILRGSSVSNSVAVNPADLGKMLKLAEQSKGSDRYGYRSEFLKLVRTAAALYPGEFASGEVDDDHLYRDAGAALRHGTLLPEVTGVE